MGRSVGPTGAVRGSMQHLRNTSAMRGVNMNSMLTPTVRLVMTPAPQVIDAHADTATAHALMQELEVRHLPVMDRDRLVGVLSERDLRGARAFLDHAPGVLGPVVGDLCSRNLLVVGPDDPLDVAATAMADRKVGAALVVNGIELVGIMTSVDVCRGLTDLVQMLRVATAGSEPLPARDAD